MMKSRFFGLMILFAIAAIAMALLLMPLPVHSDTTHPNDISFDWVYCNRNVLATGDVLIYGLYNVDYTTAPDDGIDDTFIFRIIDTDGTTELGSALAYSYQNDGYGKGVISWYWDAASAPTWGQNYYIRVSGMPSTFDDPPVENFIIPSAAWSSLTTQQGNRDEITSNVITAAEALDAEWGSGYDLLTAGDAGNTVFSNQGETYFTYAIAGIRVISPSLFNVQVQTIEYTKRSWNTTQVATYEGRWTGTQIGNAVTGVAENMFNTDFHMIASIPILLACIGVIFVSAKTTGAPYSGFINALAIMLCGMIMGWTPGLLIAVLSFMCVLYIGYFVFLRTA